MINFKLFKDIFFNKSRKESKKEIQQWPWEKNYFLFQDGVKKGVSAEERRKKEGEGGEWY